MVPGVVDVLPKGIQSIKPRHHSIVLLRFMGGVKGFYLISKLHSRLLLLPLCCAVYTVCTDADDCPGAFISTFPVELLSGRLSPSFTIHPRNHSPLSLIYLLQSSHYPRWGALVGHFRSQKALRRQGTGPLVGMAMGSVRGMYYDWCSTGLKRACFWVCALHTMLSALDNWAW